jgi:methyl-accepting chemotaxis protein
MLGIMRRARNLSVRTKLIVACGLLALITGMVGAIAIWALSSTNGALQIVVNQSISAVDYLEQAERDMIEAQVAERSLMFMKMGTPDANRLVKEHQDNLNEVEAGWKKYTAIPASQMEKELWTPFEGAWREWEKTSIDVLKILAEDTPVARRDAIDLSMGESAAQFIMARDVLDKLTGLRMNQARANAQHEQAQAARFWWWMVGFVGAALIFAVSFSLVLARYIAMPLSKVASVLHRVADGDLTVDPIVQWNAANAGNLHPTGDRPATGLALRDTTQDIRLAEDELGVLVNSLNKMVHDLKSIITRIRSALDYVASTSDRLTTTSKKLFGGATTQMEAIDVTSSSILQMNNSLKGSNEIADVLYHLSNETSSSVLEMTSSINEMSSQIKILMEAITTTSSSIEEMSATVNGIAESISALLVSAEETASSLNEINATARNVEANANEATRLSQTVTTNASNQGMGAVKKTIEGMNRIREDVVASSGIINDLGEKSKKVGKILTVIDEITGQTNLLALNSAILAAQAGDQGKAFAVVSDEMKALADRTAISTKEISQIVNSIQVGIENAIQSMRKGTAAVEEGVQISQEAFDALQSIRDSSNRSFEMVSEIEQAMKEQAVGIKQVDDATRRITSTLKQIERSTQEHKRGTSLIVAAVQKMQSTADQVNRAIVEQTKGTQQINSAVMTVQTKTGEVLKTAKEQKVAGDLVVSSVEKIRGIAQQSTDLSSEVNSAVETLVNEAEQLKNEVNRFKLSST